MRCAFLEDKVLHNTHHNDYNYDLLDNPNVQCPATSDTILDDTILQITPVREHIIFNLE